MRTIATIVLATLLLLGTNVGVSQAAPRPDKRTATTDHSANTSFPLGDRFGFIGSAHVSDAPEAFYYFYTHLPEPQPVNYVRMVALRNGAAADSDSPDQITTAPDNSSWIIGNEPNAYSTSGQQVTPEEYANLTHEWYTRLKALNPTAQVFVGQTAYADTTFLDRWWDAYTSRYGFPPFDGYTVHANTLPRSEPVYGPYHPWTVPNNVNTMREWMNGKGLGNKPLWLTEYGVYDGRDDQGNIEWDKIKAYMQTTNEWLIANTDKVQRWFWYADVTTVADWTGTQDACWTGNLYHVNETSECFPNGANDGSLTPLGIEYLTEIRELKDSSTRANLPVVMKNASDGSSTQIQIKNPGPVAGLVTVMYYDQSGQSISSDMEFVPAGETSTVSQQDNLFLPDGFVGTAVVSSPQKVTVKVTGLPNRPVATPTGPIMSFSETGQSLRGRFLDYWLTHGGLTQFGYPITGEIDENGRTIQYLERAVFEYWPEKPDPYKVQLRVLGKDVATDRLTEPSFRPIEGFPSSGSLWHFPETGHSLSYGFKYYWLTHGGLDIFGYPISEEFVEVSPTDGKTYTVQYFERARFEYHPENKGTDYEVLLGLLGSENYRRRMSQ